MDALRDHVRREGQSIKKAVYMAIGVDPEDRKEDWRMWAEWKRPILGSGAE